ncbi:MAG: hypothetical protein B6U76_03685 [Desulfurococcales archaeon ex4484_217_2]|nr:MAG: hypothetical protein B6U76_03685 [Desulfurococcales archaeon ex4484_217_2]
MVKAAREILLTETIDLDLFLLGVLALIIRTFDMALTYRSIATLGAREINIGLLFFFKTFGLKMGILITQILSALAIFSIVYLSQKARRYGLLLRFSLHILVFFHILGLFIILNYSSAEILLKTVLVTPIIIILLILGIDLLRIFRRRNMV